MYYLLIKEEKSIQQELIIWKKVRNNLIINTKHKRAIFVISLAILIISAIIIPIVIIVEKKDKPIIIESDEDFLKYNFPGTGTIEEPFIIENYKIQSDEWAAISISNVSKNFIIRNNQLCGSYYTLFLVKVSSDSVVIANNTFNLRTNTVGIVIYDISQCQIINNTLNSGSYGIGVFSLTSSNPWSECNIINNTFINISENALTLLKIDKTVVEGNKCIFNEEYKDQNQWKRGFYFSITENITLRNNNLSNMGISILNYEIDSYLSHTIENNMINGKEIGFFSNLENQTFNPTYYSQLYFINCSFIHVKNSFLENCSLGINFAFCSNCSASGNFLSYNGFAGISIIYSIGIDLLTNIFDGNYYGLYVIESLDIEISNNIFKNGRYGCSISNSTYNLGSNVFQNNEQDLELVIKN